jgi:hypothetical protein
MKITVSLARRVPGYVALRAQELIAPGFAYGQTVVQLFLNDELRRSTYTLTNVASLFAPREAAPCRYELVLHGPEGRVVGKTEIDVPSFGTAEVRLEDHLRGPLPSRGVLVARTRSRNRLHQGGRHLGAITPHFYALYHAPDMSSLALIHPQTGLIDAPESDARWRSNLHVDVSGLAALEVFQINPSPRPAKSRLELWDGDVLLASAEATLGPRVSRVVRWGQDVLRRAKGAVRLGATGVTAPNAKPLLFQVQADGRFSASHS